MIKLHILRGNLGEKWWFTVSFRVGSLKVGKVSFGCEFYREFSAIKVVKRQESKIL